MTTYPCLESRAAPLQFGVETGVDMTAIASWMSDITKFCREYAEKIQKVAVFPGDPSCKITPRGTLSTQAKPGQASAKGSIPRFLTNSREGKGFVVSLISAVYTEIVWSLVYLHHRAFELEDLILGTGKLIEWLKSRPHVLDSSTIPPPPPVEGKESLRQYGTAAASSAVSSAAAASQPTLSASQRAAIDYDLRKTPIYLNLWFRSFRLFIERHPSDAGRLVHHIEDMRSMTNTKNVDRFCRRLADIQSFFPDILANGRTRPVAVSSAEDAILVKQEDFSYPFDGSWLEFMLGMKNLGLGRVRLDRMNAEMTAKGIGSQIGVLYDAIFKRFVKDINEKILPAVNGIDERMEKQMCIQRDFIDSVAGILTDFIIALSIQYFNYAVSFTDMAQGTTIQFRAIKTILLQIPSAHTPSLTNRQILFLSDVIPHFIRHSTDK
ncbi:MAG: hypothetical protein WC483_00545 [Candidatus Paceibacterota bacterium]